MRTTTEIDESPLAANPNGVSRGRLAFEPRDGDPGGDDESDSDCGPSRIPPPAPQPRSMSIREATASSSSAAVVRLVRADLVNARLAGEATTEWLTTSPSGQQRGKQFTQLEREHLVKAYISISEDPARGTDQSTDTLWRRIRDAMVMFWVKGGQVAEEFYVRKRDSLSSKWRDIAKEVSKFCGVSAAVERNKISGETPRRRHRRKLRRFKERYGRDFSFEQEWELLTACPRWNASNGQLAMQAATPVSTSSAEVASAVSTIATRPIGRDSAGRAPAHSDVARNLARLTSGIEKIAAEKRRHTNVMKRKVKLLEMQAFMSLMQDDEETLQRVRSVARQRLMNLFDSSDEEVENRRENGGSSM